MIKNIIISAALLLAFNLFAQKSNREPLTFDLYEIQIYTGLTINGDHILKMDKDGMLLKKNNFNSMKDSEADVVNFHKLVSDLSDSDLKSFRKSYNNLLQFIEGFDFKNYKALNQKIDTIIVDEKVLIRETINSNHDLGTRILIIDKNYKSYFINYQFCDKKLEEFIQKMNNVIPENLREKYKFSGRCS